jgi:hypothetical protein
MMKIVIAINSFICIAYTEYSLLRLYPIYKFLGGFVAEHSNWNKIKSRLCHLSPFLFVECFRHIVLKHRTEDARLSLIDFLMEHKRVLV